mmetsp:Transcript_50304/g.151466  ORF Transcript_50304/g.151466 Transcript_50304/m.151466 type:complete len:200 (+) Transcript_50304:2240-2839(+)
MMDLIVSSCIERSSPHADEAGASPVAAAAPSSLPHLAHNRCSGVRPLRFAMAAAAAGAAAGPAAVSDAASRATLSTLSLPNAAAWCSAAFPSLSHFDEERDPCSPWCCPCGRRSSSRRQTASGDAPVMIARWTGRCPPAPSPCIADGGCASRRASTTSGGGARTHASWSSVAVVLWPRNWKGIGREQAAAIAAATVGAR